MDATEQGYYNNGGTFELRDDRVGYEDDELPPDAIEQLDFLDNTTFNYLAELAKSANVELKWDMELIGEVNDFVLSFLKSKAIPIWDPYISDEEAEGNE